MTVPPDDTLCRFISPEHWSPDDNRPTYLAFSAANKKLSTWHTDRVFQNHSALEALCVNELEGYGEATLRVEDFVQAAEEALSPVFQPKAVWRPEEVPERWLPWQDAHVNIESERGPDRFPRDYRLLLAMRCEVPRRPDGV